VSSERLTLSEIGLQKNKRYFRILKKNATYYTEEFKLTVVKEYKEINILSVFWERTN